MGSLYNSGHIEVFIPIQSNSLLNKITCVEVPIYASSGPSEQLMNEIFGVLEEPIISIRFLSFPNVVSGFNVTDRHLQLEGKLSAMQWYCNLLYHYYSFSYYFPFLLKALGKGLAKLNSTLSDYAPLAR